MTQRQGRISREAVYAGVLILVSAAIALVSGELVLRAMTPDAYFVFPPGLERTFTPVPDTMPGISGTSRFIINEDGIRGPSFSDEDAFRILVVGGSTTECLYLDQAETWTRLLQDRLNAKRPGSHIWVGSVGKSGLDTRHNTLQIERLLDQYDRIDLVVLLEGVNDMRYWLNSHGNDELAAERYVTDETVLDQAFSIRPGRTMEFIQRGDFQGWRCVSCEEPFYKRTEIWRRLRMVWRAYVGSRENVLVQDEAGEIYIDARRRRRAALKEDHLPGLSRGRAAYARNLEGIIDAVQNRKARVVLMTQPSIWKSDMPAELDELLFMGGPIGGDLYVTAGKSDVYYSVSVLAEAMKQYNDELLRVCDERQVLCLDLASQISKDTSSFYDDVHFNEAGAAKVAQVLADFLTKSKSF